MLPGYAGFGANNQNSNATGVKTSFDNVVIRSRSKSDTDKDFARSPDTGAEQFDVKLALPGGTPVAGDHTLIVRAKQV